MKSFLFGIIASFLVLGSGSTGWATFVVFTDRTAFENAATGAGFAVAELDDSSDPGDPFMVSNAGGSVTLDVTSGIYNGFLQGFAESSDVVTMSSTAVTGTVTGIGFDYLQGTPSIQINGGGTETGPITPGVEVFFGVLSTDGMTINVVNFLRNQNGGLNVGTIRDTTIATVPEPSAFLFIGFVGMLVLVWRKVVGSRTS